MLVGGFDDVDKDNADKCDDQLGDVGFGDDFKYSNIRLGKKYKSYFIQLQFKYSKSVCKLFGIDNS